MARMRLAALALTLGLTTAGCTDDTTPGPAGGADATADAAADGGGDGTTLPPGSVTYHNAVRAIIEQRCLDCHVEGGAAPFVLDSWTAVQPFGPAVAFAIASGAMPPWNMDPDCRTVKRARALTEAEKATVAAWQDAGFPEGDPADYVAPTVAPPPDLGTPSLEVAAAEPYVANKSTPDDYRCFQLPHTFTEDTYVTATTIFPDAGPVVHHVLLYEVSADRIAEMEALDSADPGPGYTCYGGPGVSGQMIAGWVPGQVPTIYPDDSALVIKAGSQMVMQIHYNVLAYGADDAVPADQTSAALWTMPSGERPHQLVNISALAQGTLSIPAGNPAAKATAEVDIPVPVTYIGVIPHMHTLGKSLNVTLERWNGDTECLADVPDWDFNWQQYFAYDESDFIRGGLGDTLKLECVFDNSPENQPVVNGVQQTPVDVTWGEGTLDEMCLNYVVSLTPYYAEGTGQQCDGAAACIADCPAGDAECPVTCAFYAQNDCFGCALDAIYVQCAPSLCPLPYVGFAACLDSCTQGDPVTCAFTECATEFGAVYECLEPQLQAGACNAQTQACNFQL